MKKKLQIFIGIVCCFLFLTSTINAHPGRTDKNGGHTCRTNCAKWGLENGEYHFHNGGGDSSSDSSKEDTSNPAPTEKPASSTSKPTPAPTPVPKVDKKQVQADEHYIAASDLYKNTDYKTAITELEKIYELKKGNNKTDILVQNSITAIYGLAETAIREEDYQTAKEYLTFVRDYKSSSDVMKQKAKTLITQIEINEQLEDLLSKASITKDNKEYEETILLIQEAQELTESDNKVNDFYNETIETLLKDAEEAYQGKKYDQAISYYNLLIVNTDNSKTEEQYQFKIQEIQNQQLIQDIFGIETIDLVAVSLFNHIRKEENDTPYNDNVVRTLTSSLVDAKGEMEFTYDMSIDELFNGGQNNAD